ncbi:MAG TPA: hypothetical protein VGZ48_10790 [Candidatus Acidoferrales bacterium]|jgi:hypothetical protein|nr:hypothetical protein [Candidatus Acidoferrales bacterium]
MSSAGNGDYRLTQFDRLRRGVLISGITGLVVSVPGWLRAPDQFYRSYLLAYIFWIGIPVGSMAILMLHHLTGGGWGFVIRRTLEAATRTLWLMALLFVPLLIGMRHLYGWAQPQAASNPVYQQKHFFLNTPFFITRIFIYFALWMGLAWLLNRWSFEQDRTGDARLSKKLEGLSGPGLILWGLAVTFSSVDWIMSLEPKWFSTIYGMIIMVAMVLSAMAFGVLISRNLAHHEPLSKVATPTYFNDLGNLLLTFVMLWAYLSFSQFLIIWSGNMPEETSWYMSRGRGSWAALAVVLIIFHFAVPFALLLSRDLKRTPKSLSRVAALLVALTLVDMFWLIVPAFEGDGPRVHWTNLSLTAGIGGLWLWEFFRQLDGKPVLPLHDPRLTEILNNAEGH